MGSMNPWDPANRDYAIKQAMAKARLDKEERIRREAPPPPGCGLDGYPLQIPKGERNDDSGNHT